MDHTVRAVYIAIAAGVVLPLLILVITAVLMVCCQRCRRRRESRHADNDASVEKGVRDDKSKSAFGMSSPVVGRISYALGALSCDTVSKNKQLKYGKNLQDPTSMIL